MSYAPQPVITEEVLLALGQPKYRVTPVGSPSSPPTASDAAAAANAAVAAPAAAAGAFQRLQAAAAGVAPPEAPTMAAASGDGNGAASCSSAVPHGACRPFLAPALRNERLTAAGHPQDVRHIEFDLSNSNLTYEPGDLLAIFPEPLPAAVDAFLARLGLDGNCMVRVEHNATPSAAGGASVGALMAGNGASGAAVAAAAESGSPAERQLSAAGGCSFVASVRSLAQGVLDIAGASPRRFFFQASSSILLLK